MPADDLPWAPLHSRAQTRETGDRKLCGGEGQCEGILHTSPLRQLLLTKHRCVVGDGNRSDTGAPGGSVIARDNNC